MAGLATTPGTASLPRREFWFAQLAHQLPMLGAMVVMVGTGGSAFGMLLVVAGLWIIALARARAARRSVAAREFLLDLLAMALVVIVSLSRIAHPSLGPASMSGMAGAPLATASVAIVVVAAWTLARVGFALTPGAREHRAGTVVSGSCCAVGLVAMLLM